MSGKLSRKERAQLQKHKQQETVAAPVAQPKKKPAPVVQSGSLVRKLNIILILLVVALYGNSLSNEYALDDYSLILENTQTKQGKSAFFEIFGSAYRAGYMGGDNTLYRPLSKAMFALEWGMTQGPGINHFMNVTLFALSIVLLFKMLRLYLKGNVLIPFLTATIFAAHPLHTEVVANIKGRDDILCFLFFVITAIYVYRYSVSEDRKHLAFAGGALFLSFLSKESAITFIAVIPLLLYFFTDAGKTIQLRTAGVTLGVTALFLFIRWRVLAGGGITPVPIADNYIAGIDGFLAQRATAIAIAGIYLLKLFVPYQLVCDASLQQIPVYGFGDWQFLVPLVVFLAALGFALMKFRSKHPVSFGILYFFITFSMVSNIPFLLGTNYGERLLYAPSLGICFIMAYCIGKLLQPEGETATTVGELFSVNRKAMMVTGLIVAVYGSLTFLRNPDWHDNLTLYSTDLQKSTNSCKLHYFYANHITQQEYLDTIPKGSPRRQHIIDTSITEFRRAIALYPAYSDAIQKLAAMFFEQGQYDSSEYYYKKAIHLFPSNAAYRNNYGRMLFTQGRVPEARVQFEAAIRFNPGYATAYNNLAGAVGTQGAGFVRKGQENRARQAEYFQRAMEYYQLSVQYSLKAISYDPAFIPAYETVAMTYQNMGDAANAQKYQGMAQTLINNGQGHR